MEVLCVLFINQRGCMVDSPKVVSNDKKLSCIGTFTKTCSANIKGHRQWQHATLFIRSGVGIVYGDPKEIKHGGDQIMLSGKVLHACVMNRLMDLNVPFKPRSGSTGDSKVASRCCRNSKE